MCAVFSWRFTPFFMRRIEGVFVLSFGVFLVLF